MFMDPAFIDAISHALASPPASIVRTAADLDGRLDTFRRVETQRLTHSEREVAKWIERGLKLRESMWSLMDNRRSEVDEAAVAVLNRMITRVEEYQAKQAQISKELDREYKRLVKKAFRVSPQHGAVMRELSEWSMSLVHRQLAERADFGLFLRALRAEHDPRSREGQTFKDPNALKAFLTASLH
jgi:hypothetical protein